MNLASYLELIALREPDFSKLDHNNWERYVKKYGRHYKYCLEQTYDCNFSCSPDSLNSSRQFGSTTSSIDFPVISGSQKRLRGSDDDESGDCELDSASRIDSDLNEDGKGDKE